MSVATARSVLTFPAESPAARRSSSEKHLRGRGFETLPQPVPDRRRAGSRDLLPDHDPGEALETRRTLAQLGHDPLRREIGHHGIGFGQRIEPPLENRIRFEEGGHVVVIPFNRRLP